MTFDELCELEPRLRALADEVASVRDDPEKPSFCANRLWYDRFKPQLIRLVGFEAGLAEPTVPTVGGLPEEGERGFLSIRDLERMEQEEVRYPVDPRLKTSQAYEGAYQTLCEMLPDCRNCLCEPREDPLGL